MRIVGFDPFMTPDKAAQLGIEAVTDLDTLLPLCDYVTVHTPLTDETRHLLDARRLGLLKKGARVLNCARGGIIEEAALVQALESGHLAGAALDVFVEEPPPADHPLLKLPGVVVTPHLGASTVEAQVSVAQEAAQLMIDFLSKGIVTFAVNMAAVDRTELEELRLYVDLARRLGLMHAQMCHGTIRKAELSYRGEVARRGTKLITAAFTAGLLEHRLAQSVNIVNAELLARDRGIEVVEQSNPRKGDFSTLLKAEITTDKKTYTVAGTLFGDQYLRLVQIGPFHLDAFLDGISLIFTHRDVPGLIGFIGTIFGKYHVNIAQMTVGRQQAGGEAIAILNLDSQPPDEAMKEVCAQPDSGHDAILQATGIFAGFCLSCLRATPAVRLGSPDLPESSQLRSLSRHLAPPGHQVPHQTNRRQASQCQIGDVQLPPAVEAVVGAARVSVMVVVPAISIRGQGEEPVVAAVFVRFVVPIAPPVRCRIHAPGDVPAKDRAIDDAIKEDAQAKLHSAHHRTCRDPADEQTHEVEEHRVHNINPDPEPIAFEP
jgi:hypothetical protein